MAIPKSFIQQLLLHCDIEDVVSSYLPLKREGRNQKTLCPFHSEKTPSMVIYPNTQSFYCFGCGAGGDVISFVMRIENLDYVEAVHFLAKRAGLTVPEDGESDKTGQMKTRILEINRETARFFHHCLKSPAGKAGYDYFKNRQLSDKTITKYGLGYAPDSWNALRDHLRKKGFSYPEMEAACVVVKGKKGSYYDQFRNRVMFPIIDLRGNVIAFGGRVLDDSKPKYLNSPDTLVFKKSRNLFSLNFAKNQKGNRLILAEGYMDVISINAAGFENVVATLGTALTAEQARLISKYATEVVIAYDSDEAGQKATHRAINLLSEVGVSAKILKMSGAKDPDEYIKKFGARRFEMLLDDAGNVVEFELNKLKAAYDLENTSDKVEYVRRSISVISSIQNRMEREVYAGLVSKDTGVSVASILSQVDSAIKRKRRQQEKDEWNSIQKETRAATDRINPEKANFYKEALAEEQIIAYLLRNPEDTVQILSQIREEDFVTSFNRKVLSCMISLFQANNEIVLSALTPYFIQPEMGRISQILARTDENRFSREVLEDCIRVLKQHKSSLKAIDLANATPEELERYRENLKKRF
ncbi:DNA primase [Massilimaliae timonensis]|uniref:DNA primase n=1 Tax=Massiliimalia timonensis TaxID=1987501 RepID=A0A8J6P9U3_9FIRM|nr:DNA primase [Massiliimalia timonensis]MBC8609787.1 DNA primase [Massiliimalia timonensis]